MPSKTPKIVYGTLGDAREETPGTLNEEDQDSCRPVASPLKSAPRTGALETATLLTQGACVYNQIARLFLEGALPGRNP